MERSLRNIVFAPGEARRTSAAIIAASAFALAVLAWQIAVGSHDRQLFGDFQAFYCGGSTIAHARNPYTAQPLLNCERTPQPFGLHNAGDQVDLPAPFPGYTLAFYAVFSFLPYPLAALAWLTLQLLCIALACVALNRLCVVPIAACIVLMSAGFAIAAIPYGELSPIALCLLSASALLLNRDRRVLAVALAVAAAILPHVAVPALLALFIWRKEVRTAIVAGCAFLALVDVVAGGPSLALSYFEHVLPAHAASEIGFVTQYSATWAAWAAGAPGKLALFVGNLSYGIDVVLGVWIAGLLARRYAEPAFLVLVPPAFAVVGGSFIHFSELLLALPAALLLFMRSQARARYALAAALVLIALPWQSLVTQPMLLFPITVCATAIAALILKVRSIRALQIGLAAAVLCGVILIVASRFGPQTGMHAWTSLDTRLAEASWADHVRNFSSGGIVWWIAKMPTWIGLLCAAAACVPAVSERAPDEHLVPVVAVE